MVDTADVYSAWVPGHQGGESETVIGNWLKRDPAKRDKVVIATKVGFFEGLAPDKIAAACDASLQRLGDRDDRPLLSPQGRPERAAGGKPRRDGRAGKGREGAGHRPVAIFGGAARRGDADRRSERPGAALRAADLVQSGRAAEAGGRASRHCARARARHRPLLRPRQRLPHAASTGRKEDLDKSVRGLRNVEYLEGKGMRVLEALDRVAAETGAALATIALAWTNAQPGITSTLASATSVDQLRAVDRGHAPSPDAGAARAARRGEPLVLLSQLADAFEQVGPLPQVLGKACGLIGGVALDAADHAAPGTLDRVGFRSRSISVAKCNLTMVAPCQGTASAASRLSTNGCRKRDERLAFLEHVQRGDGQRFGRGGDHRFRVGRPERAVQRRQLRWSPAAASHLSFGTPPTQKIRLSMLRVGMVVAAEILAAPSAAGPGARGPSPKCCLNSAARLIRVRLVGVERPPACIAPSRT